MRKDDIARSYHRHHSGHPMINVKHGLWMPDLIRRWRTEGHEFSGDERFWTWVEQTDQAKDDGYPTPFNIADEIAREVGWDDAREVAHQLWPQYSTEMVDEKRWFPEYPPGSQHRFTGNKVPRKNYHVNVYSAGRSGGWLVVDGLPDIDTWDAIDLGVWRRFDKAVHAILDDYPYQYIWHLHVNVWQPTVADPANEAEQWVEALATLT